MKHDWFVHPKFSPLVTCRACGIVRGKRNKPCPGKVRIVLRDNRISGKPPTTPEDTP